MALSAAAVPVVSPGEGLGEELADDTPAHIGLALKTPNPADLDQLLAEQSNPESPLYRAWLTPEEFGRRFGVPTERYSRIIEWIRASGLSVQLYPNHLFMEATGTAAQVHQLLGVRLYWAAPQDHSIRTFKGEVSLPADIEPDVLHISGLDTHVRRRHLQGRLKVAGQGDLFGAGDLRAMYDLSSYTAAGTAAAGLTTAVLGTQEGTQANANAKPTAPFVPPSTQAIAKYFSSVSNATATYNPVVMTNTNNDFDTVGANEEYQLDVEMQSVGAANADSISLVMSPSSEVFTTGAQYVVNTLSTVAVVSTSLGLCESEESKYFGGGPTSSGSEVATMRLAVQQGVAEGQTWFAAAGDEGADDCNDSTSATHNGFDGGNATVDFPGSMPEIVDMGGTQLSAAGLWNASGDITAWQAESVWNEGVNGGAGGGGQSEFYAKPSWQIGIGPEASDGVRDVPDISLSASTAHPGVAVYACGNGQEGDSNCQGETTGAGSLVAIGGTSVASPLAAGFFALVSAQVGCRLGDIHATLYALGAAQQNGGPQVFHDVTSGNNNFKDPKNVTITGFAAGDGYDLASGWGSLDVAAIVANWPACTSGTSTSSSSSSSRSSTGSSGKATAGSTATSGGGTTTAGTSATRSSTGRSASSSSAANSTSAVAVGSTSGSSTGANATSSGSTGGSFSITTSATSSSSAAATTTAAATAVGTAGSSAAGTAARTSAGSGATAAGSTGTQGTSGAAGSSAGSTGATKASASGSSGSSAGGVGGNFPATASASSSTGTRGASSSGCSSVGSNDFAGQLLLALLGFWVLVGPRRTRRA
jgi:subtilase family serine protease